MKNLTIEKQTINYQKKMYYTKNKTSNKMPKQANIKYAINFGHYQKDNIEKYGLKQAIARYDEFDLIA